MNYDELIKNWHTKASNEDYFSKFVFEYLAFIAFLRKKRYPDCVTERAAIQSFKRSEIKNTYLELIQSDRNLKHSWNKIKEELDRSRLGNVSGGGDSIEEMKWWNCSHERLEAQTPEEKALLKGVIHSLNDWENMVEFWSAIRNNLFHGGKDPEESRDKLLVQDGFNTLRGLVACLLEHE